MKALIKIIEDLEEFQSNITNAICTININKNKQD